MPPLRRTASIVPGVLIVTLALAGCGDRAESPSAQDDAAASDPSPDADIGIAASDLSVIACATDDPADVGELTGAWAGDDRGVYYIRQVGDCVWWFGTDLVAIEPGQTGQPGGANVASGRVDGTRIVVEWADIPLGDILGGGGLTLIYDEQSSQLMITERRGNWEPPFSNTLFTRIEVPASPDTSPSESARP